MSDKITTLHLKNDPSTNVYPNVKMENIPLDVTIAQGGANLATSGTIYSYIHSNFLSLDGGTMNGFITIDPVGIPEKVILGDGVEVVYVSSQSNVTTHYGSGYILQDDDEDESVKYEYNFPKKSGTFALEEDLNLEYSTTKFLHYFDFEEVVQGEFKYNQKNKIPNGIYLVDNSVEQGSTLHFYFTQFYNILTSPLIFQQAGIFNDIGNFYTDKSTYISFDCPHGNEKFIFIVFGNIVYVDLYEEV